MPGYGEPGTRLATALRKREHPSRKPRRKGNRIEGFESHPLRHKALFINELRDCLRHHPRSHIRGVDLSRRLTLWLWYHAKIASAIASPPSVQISEVIANATLNAKSDS